MKLHFGKEYEMQTNKARGKAKFYGLSHGVVFVGVGIALSFERRPTKHAPDVVESATSVSIFPTSEVSASEAESKPTTTQVM